MKYSIYSIRDLRIGFGQPFVDLNDVSASRGFSYAINSKDGIMNFKPSDFELFKIGSFETDTGVIEGIFPLEMVVSGISVVES